MRGDATFTLDVDFGRDSRWGVRRYFEEQLAYFDRWLPDDATGQPADEAPVRIFVMGGGSGRKTALGQARPRRPLARRAGVAARARAGRRRSTSHGDGSLAPSRPPAAPSRGGSPTTPTDPVPTIGGNYCAVGELPAEGEGMEPMWMRLLNPALLLRNIMTPGPRRPEGVARRSSRRARAVPAALRAPGRARLPDRAARRAGRGDRAARVVDLRISSSALDTDFTAKLIDVYPPNEDYPDGYDMLINDSIIRCRYREGFDREVLMEPGERRRRSRSCCRRRRTCSRPATGSGSTSRRRTSRGSSATRTPASRSGGTRTRSSPSRRSTPTRSTRRTWCCPSFRLRLNCRIRPDPGRR